MNILKYKEYEGTAEIDTDRHICRGKILFINDLVTYEAPTPADLQIEFQNAVDDYLETCRDLGREAQKPLKGQFNVRISPELHKQATLKSVHDNISLNEVVKKALESFLYASHEVNHNLRVSFTGIENQEVLQVSSTTEQWTNISTIKTSETRHACH